MITFITDHKTFGGETMIDFNQDKASIQVTADVRDAQGNPAQVENFTWTSSNPALVRNAGQAGLMVILEHPDRNSTGSCQLSFNADADLGSGVVPISHTEDVIVSAGQGASVSFQVN